MIKIAYFIDTIESPNAGTEQQLLMLLNNLDRSRFSPYLLYLNSSPWLAGQEFSFPTKNFEFNKIFSPGLAKFVYDFRLYHKQEKFDIVQTFFIDANIAGVAAAKLAGVKNILASRRNAGDRTSSKQLKVLRFLTRYTTKYLANSKAIADMARQIEGMSSEQMEVIYNGMYLDKFKTITPQMRARQRSMWGIGDDDILIGLTANLRAVKNIDSLIISASTLTMKFPDLKFVVVGEGPNRANLQEQIDSFSLSDRFTLAGRHENIIPCLSAFDIGVLCSRAEGFSNSLIEYMAAGLPVVASDVGGNAEAVNHGKTGLIYSLKDPHGLSQALTQLIEQRQFAKEMASQAKKEAFDKYDVMTYIKNHENFYAGLVAR